MKKGRQTFDAATKHIYDPQPSDWTGRFELLSIGNGEDRDAAREALKNAGFGTPPPGDGSRLLGVPMTEEAASAIRLEVSNKREKRSAPAPCESWPLDRTADAYLKLMQTFEPLRGWIGRREKLSEADAFTAWGTPVHRLLPARGTARSAAADRPAALRIGRDALPCETPAGEIYKWPPAQFGTSAGSQWVE